MVLWLNATLRFGKQVGLDNVHGSLPNYIVKS